MAVFIAANLAKYPKVVWELPTGSGKSFIISALALIALLGGDTETVHFVVPSEVLLEREKMDFRCFWDCVDKGQERVKYYSSLQFTPKPKDLVIVDEADMLLLEDLDVFFEFVAKATSTVCFTATTGSKNTCFEN